MSEGTITAIESAVLGATLTNHATRVDVALATVEGAILARGHDVARSPLSAEDMLSRLGDLASALRHPNDGERYRLVGVALAIEGSLDVADGVVLDLPSVDGWGNVSLGAQLAATLGAPANIDTVTNATLMAEVLHGAGQGASSAAYIDLSRAITSAFLFDSRLLHRPHLGAIGHFPVADGGARCVCGGYGHLETVASAQSLVRSMIGLLVEAPETESAVMAITDGRAESLTAPQIWQLACDGDPIARMLMDHALDGLATAVNFLTLALDVECIILGGSLARAGESWLDALRERVGRLAPPRRATSFAERLKLASLGAAALRGTVDLARRAAGYLPQMA